jgi:hypothetical protein
MQEIGLHGVQRDANAITGGWILLRRSAGRDRGGLPLPCEGDVKSTAKAVVKSKLGVPRICRRVLRSSASVVSQVADSVFLRQPLYPVADAMREQNNHQR